jgi:sulfite exporter TauE/SafE/copper chaperone CopZ
MSTSPTRTFFVHGMHCASCELLTKTELEEHPKVVSAHVSLSTRTVDVTGDFGNATDEDVMRELSNMLQPHGYALSNNDERRRIAWSEFHLAIPLALAFILLFLLLQKLGIVNLVQTDKVTVATAFMIGIIASLSTCMAVVGGLVLSLSATFAKNGSSTRSHVFFHVSRLVSFFLLGGVIGMIGSAFQLGIVGTFILGLLVGIVMLILGLNLLDVFTFTKRLQLTMPERISKHALGVGRGTTTFTPLLAGLATFFLPCGFTQSMQVYTLSTGSFVSGGLTMLSFALGTLPVLALLSFGSFTLRDHPQKGVFFKTAGLVVILFALLNIANSLVTLGVLPPFLNI